MTGTRRRLEVGAVALDNILVGTHVLGPRLVDDHARAHRRRAADEEHDARALPGRGGLEQTHGHGERRARAPRGPLVPRHGPGVLLQVLQDGLDGEGAVADGHEVAADRRLAAARGLLLLALGLGRALAAARRAGHVQEFLDALRRVVLGAAERDGLVALAETDLVHEHVRAEGDQAHERVLRQ
jgi:hypothetical protein